MSETSERVLEHIKFLNDQFEPTTEGVHTGSSLRVVVRTTPSGRVSVSGSVSYRVHRMRASGKVFRYWQTQQAFSLLRTKAGLVVLRVLEHSSRRNSTQHLFAGGEAPAPGPAAPLPTGPPAEPDIPLRVESSEHPCRRRP